MGFLWWRDLGDRSQIPSALMDRLLASAVATEREIDAELVRWAAMTAGPDNVGGLPLGGPLLLFESPGVARVKGDRLAYYPLVLASDVPADERLERAQATEFKQCDLDAAIAAYREAATSTGRTVRA